MTNLFYSPEDVERELVRGADGQDRPEQPAAVPQETVRALGDVLAHHWRTNPPGGKCSCGHEVPLGAAFTAHQVQALLESEPGGALASQARAEVARAEVEAQLAERSTSLWHETEYATRLRQERDVAETERDRLAETLRLRSEALGRVTAENAALRAQVARVEALVEDLESSASAAGDWSTWGAAEAISLALKGGDPGE